MSVAGATPEPSPAAGPARCELAVLDMAGTTVSDGGIVEASFLDALATVGIARDDPSVPAHLDHVRATMGQSKIVVFRAILDGDEDRAQAANVGFEAAFARRVAAGDVGPLPGAEDVLARLRAGGVRVCLTTGFSASTQQALLDHLGWQERIDLALCPGEGLRGRPHPDLVLAAVLRLGVDDVRAVAVAGDTANDLLAGTRAGAGVVAGVLTGAHDRSQLDAAPHTHVLASIVELPPLLGV